MYIAFVNKIINYFCTFSFNKIQIKSREGQHLLVTTFLFNDTHLKNLEIREIMLLHSIKHNYS